jgi:DNA-binding FadR family transcriptional regulator
VKSALAPIRRQRLHDQITRQIAIGIIRGEIQDGDPQTSTENDLCRHLGVGRNVLREAIKVLAAKGLVEVRPKVGVRVKPREEWNVVDPDLLSWQCEAGVDGQFIQKLLEMRLIVEPPAADLAAQRATKEEIAKIEDYYSQIQNNIENKPARFEADAKFHEAIFLACHNEFLMQMNLTIGSALRATQQISSRLAGIMEESLLLHKEVAEAIRNHDGGAARNAMERIVRSSSSYIYKVMHPDKAATLEKRSKKTKAAPKKSARRRNNRARS